MKNILIILFLLVAFSYCKAQTIDTAYKVSISCKVNPFLYNPRTDMVSVERMSVDQLLFKYSNGVSTIDINYTYSTISGYHIYSGVYTVSGIDYIAIRQGIKDGYAIIFSILGNKLNITYQ